MNKTAVAIIKRMRRFLVLDFINKLARKTKFVQRKSKLTAEKFVSLCVFLEDRLCTCTLSDLCTKLELDEDIQISPEGLNNRFNTKSVEFLKTVFMEMLKNQNAILREQEPLLKTHFNRIKVADSTMFALPEEYVEDFKGFGGIASKSTLKIQLEYNILNGEFLNCDVFAGAVNDKKYLPELQKNIQAKDLCLKDLGYVTFKDLEYIDSNNAYYITKLRDDIIVSTRHDRVVKTKRKTKIKSEFCKIDIDKLAEPLAEGETIELKDIYVGRAHNLKSRLIITKLSEKDKTKRGKKRAAVVKRGRGKMSERGLSRNGISVCITNIPEEFLKKEQVYELYSLRWQIEIMFKIWKSIFLISKIKRVKLERFLCFLYGRLIALLLSTSIVYAARDIVFEEEKKEVSEYKASKIAKGFLKYIKEYVFDTTISAKLLYKIICMILRHGIKSRKKGKKTAKDILKDTCGVKEPMVSLVI